MVIILCAICIVIILILFLIADARSSGSCILGVFGGVSISILLFIIMDEKNPSIKPIDVYRGKTTLEITYHDSIAVDSVVIWKEKVI